MGAILIAGRLRRRFHVSLRLRRFRHPDPEPTGRNRRHHGQQRNDHEYLHRFVLAGPVCVTDNSYVDTNNGGTQVRDQDACHSQ